MRTSKRTGRTPALRGRGTRGTAAGPAAALAVLAALILAACGEPAPGGGAEPACPYPPGGPRPAVHHADPDRWLSDVPVWTVRETRVLGAPSRSDGSGVALGAVSDVAVDGAGRVYAADVREDRIWSFAADGSARRVGGEDGWPHRTAGRQTLGVGPGDTLRAFDHRLRAEAAIDTAGRLVRTWRVPDPRGFGPGADVAYGGGGILHRLGYGPFAASLRAAVGDTTGVVDRGRVAIERWSRPDSAWTELATVAGPEVYVAADGVRGAPFGRRPLWDAAPDGSVWHADSGEYLLTRLSAAGDTLCRIEVGLDPPEVSEEDRRAYLQAEDVSPYRVNARRRLRRTRQEMPLPGHRPVLRRLLAGPRGGVWVRPAPERWNAEPGEATWHAFTPGGGLAARVRVPGDVRIERVGRGWLLGVRREDTGVDRVVRLQLAEGG